MVFSLKASDASLPAQGREDNEEIRKTGRKGTSFLGRFDYIKKSYHVSGV